VIIDMHCHLDLYQDPYAVAGQCKSLGIYALSVTTTPRAWHGTSRLAADNPRIRTALGFHPQIAHERINEQELFDTLLPAARYVGEIGLDGRKSLSDHWDVQLQLFRHILRSVGSAGGRLMSIHSRGCLGAVLSELDKFPSAGLSILHWPIGTQTELRRAVSRGCWFSVGPAMLESRRGQELAASLPRDKILPETDGPLARVGHELLMPWETARVFSEFAKLWRMPLIDAEATLCDNFTELAKMAGPW
jgi:TatD DNase family protein